MFKINFSGRAALALFSLLFVAMYVISCAKDSPDSNAPAKQDNPAEVAERAPIQYGLTVYGGPGAPSKIVNLNAGTTAIVPGVPDLKGICLFNGGSGDCYVTSGANNPVGFQNRLYKVNPATGAILASYGPAAGYGTIVSDICMIDVAPLTMYGLRGNTNTLAKVGPYPTFAGASFTAMTGIAAGWVARGLSWTKNPSTGVFELVAFCTRAGANGKAYRVNTATAACSFIGDFTPAASFNGNNCGAGYFYFPNPNIIINRSGGAGLGIFSWVVPPFAAAVPWPSPVADYEDLASILY